MIQAHLFCSGHRRKKKIAVDARGGKNKQTKNPPSFPAVDMLLNDIVQLLSGLGRIGKHVRISGYNANSKSNI